MHALVKLQNSKLYASRDVVKDFNLKILVLQMFQSGVRVNFLLHDRVLFLVRFIRQSLSYV